jgi:hypothetical protein
VLAVVIAVYEATNEQMPALQAAPPEEYRPVLVILFLVLLRWRQGSATAAPGHETVHHSPLARKLLR